MIEECKACWGTGIDHEAEFDRKCLICAGTGVLDWIGVWRDEAEAEGATFAPSVDVSDIAFVEVDL